MVVVYYIITVDSGRKRGRGGRRFGDCEMSFDIYGKRVLAFEGSVIE